MRNYRLIYGIIDMQDALNKFYEKNKISAINFNCEHFKICKGKHTDFTTSKECYIGERYGINGMPKLLFLSLDSGDSNKNANKRTMQSIKEHENQRLKLEKPNTHWSKTFKLAKSLLEDFIQENINEIEINKYFAHTNSAKCCQNKLRNANADPILFKNCRKFIGGEIEILNPDIIITQGEQAKKALKSNAFKVCSFSNIQEVQMQENSKKILWFHSTHPTAWQNNNFINFEKKHFKDGYFKKWRDIINLKFKDISIASQ